MPDRYCIVIPHYCHDVQLADFLPLLAAAQLPLLVVDDGSPAQSRANLEQLISAHPWAQLVAHEENRGKGAAMVTGLTEAHTQGFTHAILVDADGQHDPADIARLHAASLQAPEALFSGKPIFGEDIPASRLYGRMITNTLAKIEAGNWGIEDAMCGLRLYPLAQVLPLCSQLGNRLRMEFDTEILVRASWADLDIHFLPTQVRYPETGRSHFRMIQDNVRLTAMHSLLLLGALVRLPARLWRRLMSRAQPNSSSDTQ